MKFPCNELSMSGQTRLAEHRMGWSQRVALGFGDHNVKRLRDNAIVWANFALAEQQPMVWNITGFLKWTYV
jgi:hypothetical protein